MTSPAPSSAEELCDYYLIFGYAIPAVGDPGHAMTRRVQGAVHTAGSAGHARIFYLATGGVGRYPPSEASLMAGLLTEHGVRDTQIVLEEASGTTLHSVIHCAALLPPRRERGRVVVCTDSYHRFRCRALLLLLGIPTVAGRVDSGRREHGVLAWAYFHLREAPALLLHAVMLYPMCLWIGAARLFRNRLASWAARPGRGRRPPTSFIRNH